jgi:hypothetical protein
VGAAAAAAAAVVADVLGWKRRACEDRLAGMCTRESTKMIV